MREIPLTRGQTTVLMHREIMGPNAGEMVDHINHNGLDNRRANLRRADRFSNQHNQRKHRDNRSGYKGVTKHNKCDKWMARAVVKGKIVNIAFCDTAFDAAIEYDNFAATTFGEFAYLNFP